VPGDAIDEKEYAQMNEPDVTIVVVPRERFSLARRALECLYAETEHPFNLVYVDGGSPERTRRYLEAQAKTRGFRLIRSARYLAPTEARNLGLSEASGKYVVFIDNDVLVKAGWLEALVRCAHETGAWLVGPLYCLGEPAFTKIHMVGGTAHIELRDSGRSLAERHHLPGGRLEEVQPRLQRSQTELVEFHCLLARTEIFQRLGPLDARLLSDFEHIDLCLAVREAGGSIYIEPEALVNWVAPPPLAWSDLPYFMLRWSDAWNRASLQHFRAKWHLTEKDPNGHYEFVTNYRRLALWPLRRVIRKALGWRRGTWLERNALFPMEEALNRLLIPERFAQRH
jgi:GT2 family glycosyltransferase